MSLLGSISAKFWRRVLLPVIARYRELKIPKCFRGDAAFASPKLFQLLEEEIKTMTRWGTAMEDRQTEWRDDALLIAVGTVCWASLVIYFMAIGFNWLAGDPKQDYWEKSTRLLGLLGDPSLLFTVQHRDQVPAYTYLIAAVRATTGLSRPGIMQWLCYFAWIANLIVVRHILRALDVPRSLAIQGAAVYGVFPLTGLTNAVFPLSDHLALLAGTAGLLAYLKGRPGLMAGALGVASMTHKFMWPVSIVLVMVGLLRRRIPIWAAVAVFIPLSLYWIGVSVVSDSTHLIAGNVRRGFAMERVYPIADGILGNLFGSPKDAVQGLICLGIAMVSAVLCFTRPVRREPALLSLVAPLALFGLVTNQKLVWGLGRFGPMMVVPLFLWLAGQSRLQRARTPVVAAIFLLSLATQFVFASYVKALGDLERNQRQNRELEVRWWPRVTAS